MRVFSIICIVLFFLSFSVWANVPIMLNFQGRLTDNDGDPITATQKFKFSLRNAETGGEEIWAMAKVFTPDQNGKFEVTLTGGTPDLSTVDLSSETGIWLKIQNAYTADVIGTQQLKSVPFALRAKVSETLALPQDISINNDSGPALRIINTSAAYKAGAAFVASTGVGVSGFGLLSGVYARATAPTFIPTESLPIMGFGLRGAMSAWGTNIPGTSTYSEGHYGILAISESNSAGYFENQTKTVPAVYIKSKSKGLKIESTDNESYWPLEVVNSSTSVYGRGIRAVTEGGGNAGEFINDSDGGTSTSATLHIKNTGTGKAGYFYCPSGTGLYTTSAQIGSGAPVIETHYMEVNLLPGANYISSASDYDDIISLTVLLQEADDDKWRHSPSAYWYYDMSENKIHVYAPSAYANGKARLFWITKK